MSNRAAQRYADGGPGDGLGSGPGMARGLARGSAPVFPFCGERLGEDAPFGVAAGTADIAVTGDVGGAAASSVPATDTQEHVATPLFSSAPVVGRCLPKPDAGCRSESLVCSAVVGGVMGMVFTLLLLPYWSSASAVTNVDDMADSAGTGGVGNAVDMSSLPAEYLLTDEEPYEEDRVEANTGAHEEPVRDGSSDGARDFAPWSGGLDSAERSVLVEHNQKILLGIRNMSDGLAALSSRLAQIDTLAQQVTALDEQLRLVVERDRESRAPTPDFIANAIKQLGGQSWVSVVERNGAGVILRVGEQLRDWKVGSIDVSAGIVVFEHSTGLRHRVAL